MSPIQNTLLNYAKNQLKSIIMSELTRTKNDVKINSSQKNMSKLTRVKTYDRIKLSQNMTELTQVKKYVKIN